MSLSQLPPDTLARWGVDPSWFTLPGQPTDQHWIPVSGGADSSALAILMHLMYPEIEFKLLFTDTLAEEPEIYTTLDKLEAFLEVPIIRLKPELGLYELIEKFGGYMPSASSRYCTRELKLRPWEMFLKGQIQSGQTVHAYVGIRVDEQQRLAFTHDLIETHMPFIDLDLKRKEVYAVLADTIGIPRSYDRRSRSGCSCCPFQRTTELVGLYQAQPIEFERGMKIEKPGAADLRRFPANATPVTDEVGLTANHLSFPIPARLIDPDASPSAWGRWQGRGEVSLFGTTGFFVAYEFLVHPGVGGDGVWWQNFVTFSTSLAGIKKQLDTFYQHRLSTAELKGIDEDQMREELRLVIAFIEAPADLVDTDKLSAESFTWKPGVSFAQIRHLVDWGRRSLHAAWIRQELARTVDAEDHPLSWRYEHRQGLKSALKKLHDVTGDVVCFDLYEPKEPDPEEEFDENLIACPMCSI
mgnify:FL=1|jgi:hypothetical protein